MVEQVAPPGIIRLFREAWPERHLLFPALAHDDSAPWIAVEVGIGATEKCGRITCIAPCIVLVTAGWETFDSGCEMHQAGITNHEGIYLVYQCCHIE